MEVEKAKCECCGFTEECTPAYIAAVRAEYMGRWVCGLCAEAVGDEIRREDGTLTTAEALDRHVAFARAPRARPRKASASDDLVAAVARLLRRCLDSPPVSPAAHTRPHGRKVAAGPGSPDGADA
jgi:ribosome-binding protein aMBF1 (putative translation factor)